MVASNLVFGKKRSVLKFDDIVEMLLSEDMRRKTKELH